MTVEIRLFGFGDERPARFAGVDRLALDIDTPATPRAVLQAAGIEGLEGLVLMNVDQVIPPAQWNDKMVNDEDRLTLFSAIEGG